MAISDDIANLFKTFDGNADAYQEVMRDDVAANSRANWPLLAAVDIRQRESVPAVGSQNAPPAARAQPLVPPAQPLVPPVQPLASPAVTSHFNAPSPARMSEPLEPASPSPASGSILGQLFDKSPAPATETKETANDLSRLFNRLEGGAAASPLSSLIGKRS